MLKKLKISLILFSMPLFLMGSGFEGKIKVVKKTYYDTSHYYYYVKDNKVRIDEYNQHDRLINSLIIDLSEERVFALNQDKKIYKELQPSHHNDGDSDDKYVIKKTNNTKRINGYLCYQW